MTDNKITKPKTVEEIRKTMLASGTGFESGYILKKADEEAKSMKDAQECGSGSYLYKAMTVLELDKGVLMMNALPELYRVFALEFAKNLHTEFNCTTPMEKSLAEVVALNFSRLLYIQNRITAYLGIGSITDMGVKYFGVLSQEQDRAQRHYLTSLEALKTLHMPSLGVNIKTNTAIVGQNQAVQVKNA